MLMLCSVIAWCCVFSFRLYQSLCECVATTLLFLDGQVWQEYKS